MSSNSSTASPAAPSRSALAPLQFPVFRNVWAASTISNLGGLIQSVGASWMMTAIAQSADMVALVQASLALPIVLLALIAGAMADSFDKRRVMLGAQAFMLIASLALAACSWLDLITPWLLLAFTFLIGCGTALQGPAWQASVGDMVPRVHLTEAIGLNSMGFNIARCVGPAIGGLIVATAGAAAAFTANAASYIPLIFVLVRWRSQPPPQALPRESLGLAVAAGIRYVWMSPALRRTLGRSAVFCFGAGAPMALMPLMAKHLLGGGPLIYGLLLGAFGFGAVGGALGTAQLHRRLTTEGIVRGASIVIALAVATSGFSSYLSITMLSLFLTGAAWVLVLSTLNVSLQLSTPRWVVARALSLFQMVAFSGIAAGSWLWGVIAERHTISTALIWASLALLLCVLIGRWLPLRQAEDLNLDPLGIWQVPQTAVPVEARTGPVVIAVEYKIHPDDVIEFLRAMNERGRIRRRDGARNWMLLRDLADPELWIERYNVPTWIDYIRHNSRLTQDDADIPARIRALHRGPDAPVVRRMIERQSDALPLANDSAAHDLAEPLTDPTRAS
jgi:predicted MFS family arabinose efflux permease